MKHLPILGALLVSAFLATATSVHATDSPNQPITASLVTAAFTYQGKLDKSSIPTSSTCNFQFSLWDDPSAGTQIGSTQALNSVTVTNGLFTVQLDFGSGAFTGQARWLAIAVQCAGDGGYTPLSPRQALTAVPFAMHALGGAASLSLPFVGNVNSPSQTALEVNNTATTGLFHGIHGRTSSTTQNACGVRGDGLATSGLTSGIQGYATASPSGTGVVGIGAANGAYFRGESPGGNGLYAVGNESGTGVYATSSSGIAVDGEATSGWGVFGRSQTGIGVFGQTLGNSTGVTGRCEGTTGQGVYGYSPNGAIGVWGVAEQGDAVVGQTNAANKSGVYGSASQASSFGGFFANLAGGVALKADGRAQIRVLEILGADLVEKFDSKNAATDGDPGTVVVIDDEAPGKIRASRDPYDSKVAGVVSGAGGIPHGIHLGQGGALDGDTPVAMTGRVFVKCTTENGAIRPGDRLTTSSKTGHAMRATDATLADGAVIGKAMSSLDADEGLVLVLVNLQ